MAKESDQARPTGLRGAMRRSAGRVTSTIGDAAFGVTEYTAQQIIEDLEPYLVSEAVPRIVDGITPHLADKVVPELLARLQQYLVTQTVPQIVDGATQHLAAVTVPEVMQGATPRLVSDVLPTLLADLRPYLSAELVPEIVDELMPRLSQVIVPAVLDALMPKIEQEIAPQLVDALMPKIEREVAPQLVDALMPKIRYEVVPLILEDIVDDPSVRDLIREQSQGLFLDALESLRENIADVDNVLERLLRRLLFKPARPQPPSGLVLVMDATGGGAPAKTTLKNLAQHRREWHDMPMPPAPPGREFAYAGIITRLAAFAIDVTLAIWLVTQGLSGVVSILDSLFGTLPSEVVLVLGLLAWSLVPIYLAATWSITGRSLGSWVVGTRICTADGHKPGFLRALARALLELLGFWAFVFTSITSLFDARRRSVLDILARTEVRFVVPKDQQARYIRAALAEQKQATD